ncbi:hypothetical protein K8I31_12175 [bacterium]|nr:hypothetical protein [bacterium]
MKTLFLIFIFALHALPAFCVDSATKETVIDRLQKNFISDGSYEKLMEYGFPPITAFAAPRGLSIKNIAKHLNAFESLKDEHEIDAVIDGALASNWSMIQESMVALHGSVDVLKKESRRIESSQIDWDMVFAALIMKSKQGRIYNIEVYLTLLRCYIGPEMYAEDEDNCIISHHHPKLSYQQRLKFWPAANAILSKSKETAPLLLDYVKSKGGSESNKLRAVSLLVEIDEKLVSEDLLSSLDDEFDKKAECIKSKKINWRNIGIDPCNVPTISPEDRVILDRRKELLNKR